MKMSMENLDDVVDMFTGGKQKGIEYAESLPMNIRVMAAAYTFGMMKEFINDDSVEVVFCETQKEAIDYIDMLMEVTVNTFKNEMDIKIVDTGMSVDADGYVVRDTTIEFTKGNKKYRKTIFVLNEDSTYPSEILDKETHYFGMGIYPTKDNSSFTMTQMKEW